MHKPLTAPHIWNIIKNTSLMYKNIENKNYQMQFGLSVDTQDVFLQVLFHSKFPAATFSFTAKNSVNK